jgi:hypothetical protein
MLPKCCSVMSSAAGVRGCSEDAVERYQRIPSRARDLLRLPKDFVRPLILHPGLPQLT